MFEEQLKKKLTTLSKMFGVLVPEHFQRKKQDNLQNRKIFFIIKMYANHQIA